MLSAKGAASLKPGATPQDIESPRTQALKARVIRRLILNPRQIARRPDATQRKTWSPLTPVRKTYAGLIRRKIFRVAGDEYTIFIQGTGPDNRIREFKSMLPS